MADQLPANTPWIVRDDLVQLVEALGANNARWVGGAVRDTLLGLDVDDIDCATPLLPDEVIARCKAADIRTVPTGIEHGTVTALLPDGNVEITTLRRDVSTDGRRATVAFATEWKEDAARRDFTINALFAHPVTRGVSDYFGGLEDLAARRVRFIGEARERIHEDHLRILRYFRFQARFGAELDEEAEAACSELAGTLKGLSRERVAMELSKLLDLSDPHETVARMLQLGVLPVVLPEVKETGVAALGELMLAERHNNAVPSWQRRMAALLPADPEMARGVASRLRLSNNQRKYLAVLAARSDEDVQNARALAYREGLVAARDRLLLSGASLEQISDWEPPKLPMSGGDIVAKGVAAGPEIARILQTVEARWIAEGFPDANRVDAILSEEIGT